MLEMLKFDLPKDQASIIKVIGVGGGGSNAVTHMFKQGIKGVDFYICNTDVQSLSLSPVPNKISLGATGLGAGSIPSVGRDAAMNRETDIRNIPPCCLSRLEWGVEPVQVQLRSSPA